MEVNLGLFTIWFLTDLLDSDAHLQAQYSIPLVAVSYLFALAGSYVGLLVSSLVRHARSRTESILWLVAGAVSMGAGIWSMHFVGMVAYELPMPVKYDAFLTILSIAPSVGVSFLALYLLSGKKPGFSRLAISSLLIGAGIGAMHFMGMAAMHADFSMGYDPWLFALSIGVAVFFACVALSAKTYLRQFRHIISAQWTNPISAAIMGIAISAMHYTAMSAVRFLPGDHHSEMTDSLDSGSLLILVNGLVLLLIVLVFSAILARKAYANNALVEAISQQAKLKQEMITNLIRFQMTVENFPGGICLIDAKLNLTLANKGHYKILGLDQDAFPTGSSLESMLRFHAERGEYGEGNADELVAERIAESRLFQPMKFERIRPEDKAVLEITRSPLPGGGFVQTVMDVTEVRKATEMRLSLERELNQVQKMESLGTLASGVAHEINTPIQYIGDNIRFLQESFGDLVGLLDDFRAAHGKSEGSAESDALRKKVEEIDFDFLLQELPQSMVQSLEGIRQVAGIVNAIKEFSHPGQDEMAAVDLNSTIETTLMVSRNQWKYVAKLTTDFAADLPPVDCYQGAINQVILNMVVNAVHAIEATGNTDNGQIKVKTRLAGAFAEIEIADNGSGMPEEVRKRIFDPFYTTKDIGKGTGQGLAISYAIVHQKHGGTIECASEVGIGTRFIIRLPLEQVSIEDEQAA